MTLQSERELVNTRKKLCLLEEMYEDARNDDSEGPEVREISLRSIKRLMNQLTEEIARYEAHHLARR